jgi:hypothetical protein
MTRRGLRRAIGWITGRVILIPLAGALAAGPAPAAPKAADVHADARADAQAERMLSALGGRERWAALRNTVNDSQQYRSSDPVEVRAVITLDTRRGRPRPMAGGARA